MQAARARAGRVVTHPLAGLLCDLGPGRAWLPRGLPTSAAVSGTALPRSSYMATMRPPRCRSSYRCRARSAPIKGLGDPGL